MRTLFAGILGLSSFSFAAQMREPFGKQTFTITDLTAGEPDPNLFQIPVGYTVNDQRKNRPISQ